MTMIEKVARAICRAHGKWNEEESWHTYQDEARAAIAAMREPNPLMQRRMAEACIHPNVHRPLMGSLIDAALEGHE